MCTLLWGQMDFFFLWTASKKSLLPRERPLTFFCQTAFEFFISRFLCPILDHQWSSSISTIQWIVSNIWISLVQVIFLISTLCGWYPNTAVMFLWPYKCAPTNIAITRWRCWKNISGVNSRLQITCIDVFDITFLLHLLHSTPTGEALILCTLSHGLPVAGNINYLARVRMNPSPDPVEAVLAGCLCPGMYTIIILW